MNIFHDAKKVKEIGLEAYEVELNIKVKKLDELLGNYDDRRRKSFYCLAVNLLELQDINAIMEQVREKIDLQAPMKEKAAIAVKLFQAMADEKGIVLKLRK